MGALALLGTPGVDSDVLEALPSYATERIVEPVETVGGDGGRPEGYTYWSYDIRYPVYYLTSVSNGLGEASTGVDVTAGIPGVDGVPVAGDFPVGTTGPQGAFDYGDTGAKRRSMPVLFWLARRFDEPA